MRIYVKSNKVIPTYVGQLSKSKQDSIRRQLKGYGLTEDEIEDAMNGKISDITGNPECPINITASTNFGQLNKYYKEDRFGEYADDEFDAEITEILAEYDLDFQGWAVARAKYYDLLADDGYDTAAIAVDKRGQTGLYYIINDVVYPITAEEIESIIRSRRW